MKSFQTFLGLSVVLGVLGTVVTKLPSFGGRSPILPPLPDVSRSVESIGGVALAELGLGFSFGRNRQSATHGESSAGTMNGIWATCAARGAVDPSLTPTNMFTPAQIQVMQNLMASHHHRVMHALWHLMRTPMTSEEITTITQSYGQEWQNPHLECPMPTNVVDSNYNPYGEDFLFMHRGMVYTVQNALIAAGLPCVAPWTQIPDASDPVWPVPDPSTQGPKSDQAFQTMQNWQSAFQDPNWLSIHSLSQLGFMLEVTLHNNMHMRWAAANPPPGFTSGAPLPFNNTFPSNWPYDSTNYDWLNDPYGSHVNIHFWKLHGLVDQIVDKWLAANGYTSIAENCSGISQCYQWKGTWVGDNIPPPDEFDANATPPARQLLAKSRVGAFQRGKLTPEMLAAKPTRDAVGSAWPDDPEVFVNANFCQ